MALYRATVSATLFGQKIQNVLHFHRADAPSNGAEVLAQSLIDHFYGQIRLLCNNSINWNQIRIDRPDIPSAQPVLVATNFNGLFSSNLRLWGPLCAVFQIKTATAGRTGRGRFYVSGIEAQRLDSGVWETQAQLQLNSCAQSLEDGYADPTPSSLYTLGVMSRSATTVVEFKPCLDIVPRPVPGTQGRRNIGRGG